MVDAIFFVTDREVSSIAEARAVPDDCLIEQLTVPHRHLVWALFDALHLPPLQSVAEDLGATVYLVPSSAVRLLETLSQETVEAVAAGWAAHPLWGAQQPNQMDLQGSLYSLRAALKGREGTTVYLWVE